LYVNLKLGQMSIIMTQQQTENAVTIFPYKFLAEHKIYIEVEPLRRPATGYYFFDNSLREGCIGVANYLMLPGGGGATLALYRSVLAELVGYHFVMSESDKRTGRLVYARSDNAGGALQEAARAWAAAYLIKPFELRCYLRGLPDVAPVSIQAVADKFCVMPALVLARLVALEQSTDAADVEVHTAINARLGTSLPVRPRYRVVG
jgi:hypothetical protein